MFERFTEQALVAVRLADEESLLLDHRRIGTAHLLLGLLREETGIGARALEVLGVTLEGTRLEVAELIASSGSSGVEVAGFTPRGRHVLELAGREADRLGHTRSTRNIFC